MDKKFKDFNKFLDVKQTFLDLTKHTVPGNKEIEYLRPMLPESLIEDKIGNLYLNIGNSNTMFTSHMDTAWGDSAVVHVIKGKIIGTNGKTILGADDKAGMAIMLYMIAKGIPGLYYFFIGEEHGQIGSNLHNGLAGYVKDNKDKDELFKKINKVVSFDRADYNSVITFQHGERCCSNEFGDALAKELNDKGGFKYIKDEGGVLTDSIHFTTIYPECTNLSVGYFHQHATTETQDIEFLAELAEASCKVDWDNLPIKRDPTKVESKYYGNSNYGYDYYGHDYYGHNTKKYFNNDTLWSFEEEEDTRYSTRASVRREKDRKREGNKVRDYKGNLIQVSNAVWCEYDKEYCLKQDAIWEDIVGFYSIPDVDISNKNKNTKRGKPLNKRLSVDDFNVGLHVHHTKFGDGVITEWTPDKSKVVIHFKNTDMGKKTLFFQIAKLALTF